jgi:hypothetical protein
MASAKKPRACDADDSNVGASATPGDIETFSFNNTDFEVYDDLATIDRKRAVSIELNLLFTNHGRMLLATHAGKNPEPCDPVELDVMNKSQASKLVTKCIGEFLEGDVRGGFVSHRFPKGETVIAKLADTPNLGLAISHLFFRLCSPSLELQSITVSSDKRVVFDFAPPEVVHVDG